VGNFAVAQLSPIVISSVVATVVSRFVLGNHPAFPVPPYQLVGPWELLPYMVVGVVAGFVALLFMQALYATEDAFEKIPIPEWSKAAVGGLLVGLIGVWLPNVFGVGYSTITQALAGSLPAMTLGLLLVAKIAATSITIGSGGSGGIFAPSLFLGAMTGGFLGTFIHQWFPDATASSGAYALVTMGAVVAAATHAPISAIIIIFELTQTINIIPPLMAACVMSTLVSTFLHRDSIYTMKLRRRGIDLFAQEEPNVLRVLYVRDIIDREPEVLHAGDNLESILACMLESERTEFFVLDEHEKLKGVIHLRELTRTLAEQDVLQHVVVAGDLMEHYRGGPTEDDDLDVVAQLFNRGRGEELPVVAVGQPGKLVGSVRKRDLMQAYSQEVMRRDLAGQVQSNVLVASRGAQVELGGGYVLQEIQPPPRFFGKTIREADIARNWGVQVVLIRKRDPEEGTPSIRVASGTDVIQEGDRIVVAGTKLKVEALDVI
jgi:CIC family chloride channel protein